MVLGDRLHGVPEAPLAPEAPVAFPTWRPIEYVEEGPVGFLHFPFHNGAMATAQCDALRAAYAAARARPTRVIVLVGGPDFWSNGIHLNLIEASEHPAEESWRNINAMNDLVREIVTTDGQFTIAAMQGNAGAGGVFLALAADRVFARDGVVLNPHYKGMGNLYGSEYWTYLLPRRVGAEAADALTRGRLPMSAAQAAACGLVDAHFGATPGRLPRGGGAPRARVGGRTRHCRGSRRQASAARHRRSRAPARGVPGGRARADAAELLRVRSELSHRAGSLRAQGPALAHAALPRAAPGPPPVRNRCGPPRLPRNEPGCDKVSQPRTTARVHAVNARAASALETCGARRGSRAAAFSRRRGRSGETHADGVNR